MGCTNHWFPTVRGPWWGLLSLLLVFSLTASMAPQAWAQEAETETVEEAVVESEAPAAEATPATPEQEAYYTINTLFMFLCAVLVIFMQSGFALVEVGLNQAKNAVNILFKNVADFSLGVIVYLLIGFALLTMKHAISALSCRRFGPRPMKRLLYPFALAPRLRVTPYFALNQYGQDFTWEN